MEVAMLTHWINLPLVLGVIFVSGCASKLDDVTNPNAPTMKQVYEDYTGSNQAATADRQALLIQRPAVEPVDLQLGLPPYPERLDHLYPRLPNPDLFMYVRPHAVGVTGAPIPAYITRFSMYERQPYALPGETLDAARIITDHKIKVIADKAEQEAKKNNYERELFHE
jgi:conjugative transfer region lipoprotein (TIGR03751 family)